MKKVFPKTTKNKRYAGYILSLYFFVIAVKVLLTPLFKSPIITWDEYIYFSEAKNVISLNALYPPLYPLSISVAQQLFGSIQSSYLATKVINCFLSTTVVFPAYFLSRDFLKYRESLIVAFLSVIIPLAFIETFEIMAENLFYPLFLLSVYLIIKAENDNSTKYAIFGGLSITLTILTKPIGLVLVVAVLLLSVFKFLQQENFTKSGYSFMVSLVTVLPYLIYRGIENGFSESGLFGLGFTSCIESIMIGMNSVSVLVMKFISYFDYLVLASGVFFLIFSLSLLYYVLRRKNIDSKLATFVVFSWILIFVTLMVASIFMIGHSRITARYVFFLLPLFFIMGIKSMKRYNKTERLSVISATAIVIPLMLFVSELHGKIITIKPYAYISAYPVISVILLSLIIIPLLFVRLNSIKRRKLLFYASVLFLIELFIIGGINAIQTKQPVTERAYHNFEIGRYIASNNINVTIDTECFNEFCGNCYGLMFWANGKIQKGDINNTAYIITTRKMPYKILNQTTIPRYKRTNQTFYLYNHVI